MVSKNILLKVFSCSSSFRTIFFGSYLLAFDPFRSVILLPIAITFYITWWFIHFVDGFFSPIYDHLGINIFGKHTLILFVNDKLPIQTFSYFSSPFDCINYIVSKPCIHSSQSFTLHFQFFEIVQQKLHIDFLS